MVKVRTLAPLTNPETGDQLAAGAELDIPEQVAREWKADGKVSLVADEQAAAKTASEGNYSARVGREQAGGKNADDEETPPKKKS
jgi:hypothetical protein